MNPDTFYEKFELFADAPNAVQKIREFVLELALRGKLSEQMEEDTKDAEWDEFVQQLDAKADTSSADNELPFAIPSSWRWTTLENLGDTKPRNDAPDGVLSSFVPMTFIPAEYGRSAQHDRRPWSEIKKGYTHFKNGDVVIAKITPCFENGKSTVMDGLTGGIGAGTTELHVFRRKSRAVCPTFVIIYLKSRSFITLGIPRMTGSAGQKRVPYEYFARSPFPLPPLAEQKRIVAKVDELMALCDQLEAQQKEREEKHTALARASLARFSEAPTPANLGFLFHKSYAIEPGDLRKTILTLAVQGKLVPQDPNDEPADQFLTLIRKRHGQSNSSIEVLLSEQDSPKPFDLPQGWAWSRFPALGEFGRGKSKHRPRNDPSLFVNGSHRFVQTGDVARANGLILTHTGLYNDAGLAQSKLWPSGTLCITIAANIADSGILSFDACFPDSVVGFIPYKPIPSVKYFDYYMRTAKEHLESFAPSTAQKNINLGILEKLWIPIPPLAEQRRIVAKVDQMIALADQLEAQLSNSCSRATNLMNAIVAELTAAA